MGGFLAIAGIIGAGKDDVVAGLRRYTEGRGGNLQPAPEGGLIVEESQGNTSVVFPDYFMGWDEVSKELSQSLGKPIFSFHIHDGDLWMYHLYANGELVDAFNPIPDYWDEDISDEERERYKGSADVVAHHVPGI